MELGDTKKFILLFFLLVSLANAQNPGGITTVANKQQNKNTVSVEQLRKEQAAGKVKKSEKNSLKTFKEAQAERLKYDLRNTNKNNPWDQKFGPVN